MMKEILEKEIKSILSGFGVESPKVNFDVPTHMDMGDYSSNIAMVYAKQLSKKPMDLAEEIKNQLVDLPGRQVGRQVLKIEVVPPGFINFFFDKEYYSEVINKIDVNYGKSNHAKGYKVMVEYTDPNPFKEFHIGHLMPNIIGESVSRIIEANGAEVRRANYQGDVGLHVAKAVWAIKNGMDLMSAYAEGHKSYEESEVAKQEIIEINKKIYDKSDKQINKIYEKGKKESLGYFEEAYKKFGTKFDFYFFESEVGGFGKEIVEKNTGSIFEKSEGAVVFKGENYDKKLHTRVFINKEGLPTYEAKELGLAKIKYDRYPYDLSVIVTGNEINEYFKVLLKATSLVFPELAQKTKHLSHGMLRLPEGKMSSRTGNIISAESLINQVKKKILEKINPHTNFSIVGTTDSAGHNVKVSVRVNDQEIAEIIAIGAIKYSILRQAIGGDIIFDFDKSISFEGDSGPYLQYSAVRANSVLARAQFSISNFQFSIPESWQTTDLERLLERFPGVVSRAGSEYAPHHIVTYLIELAGGFNSFYALHKIIDIEDSTSGYRLALTQAFAQVMTSGLNLLGIKVPEKM